MKLVYGTECDNVVVVPSKFHLTTAFKSCTVYHVLEPRVSEAHAMGRAQIHHVDWFEVVSEGGLNHEAFYEIAKRSLDTELTTDHLFVFCRRDHKILLIKQRCIMNSLFRQTLVGDWCY